LLEVRVDDSFWKYVAIMGFHFGVLVFHRSYDVSRTAAKMIVQRALCKFRIIEDQCVNDGQMFFSFLDHEDEVRAFGFQQTIPGGISDSPDQDHDSLEFVG
jgi:hypothetical protein